MNKFLVKIFLFFGILSSFGFSSVGAVNLEFEGKNEITRVSISQKSGDFKSSIEGVATNVLKMFKLVIGGLLVIYLVYAGVMMIISMGDDEEKLSSAKRSLWYSIIGLLFVNIPGTLYEAFTGKRTTDSVTQGTGNLKTIYNRNIFINSDVFGNVVGNILTMMEIIIVAAATFMIVLQGINIMKARGEENDITEAKNKILYSILALVFVGIMVVWKNIAFLGDANAGRNLFATLANLALFFAGPIATFFLTLAGYYYITAAGDEEKVKKSKVIVINTMFATLILLGMYTFLLELQNFSV